MSVKDFTSAPLHYLWSRSALVWHLARSVPRLRRMHRGNASWEELLQAINGVRDEFLRTWQVPCEIIAAMELFECDKPQRVLEIGTARGGNLFLLSRAATEDAVLMSLDLPNGEYGGGYPNWKSWVYRGFLRPSQRAQFVRGNSHDRSCLERVKSLLDGAPIDLLFIDGDHTYDGVKQDYEMYSSLVREGGLIAFHDVVRHPDRANCQVDVFWNEIKDDFEFDEMIENPQQGWAGIGILRKNSRWQPARALRAAGM